MSDTFPDASSSTWTGATGGGYGQWTQVEEDGGDFTEASASELDDFIWELQELSSMNRDHRATLRVMKQLNRWLLAGDTETVRGLLRRLEPERLGVSVVLGVLTTTAPADDPQVLGLRTKLLEKFRDSLPTRASKQKAARLLAGLGG